MDSQSEQLRTLLEAHVLFELKQWQGKTLNERLRQEVEACWNWGERTTLKQLTSPRTATVIIRHIVLELPMPAEVPDIVAVITRHLLRLPVNRETMVADVVDRELFDDGVELLIGLQNLRQAVIHEVINSPVYSSLISEILYHGIRNYLLSENLVAQKVPGVGKILNKGAGVIGKRIPALEKSLRAYVARNMHKTVRESEQLLQSTLSGQRIRELATELWDSFHERPVALAELLDDDELDDVAAFVFEIWARLRKTDYMAELIAEAVSKVYEEYGDRPLSELLTSLGVDRKLIQNATTIVGPQLIAVLEQSGFIEETIRRRLEPFYNSRDILAALPQS